MHPTACGKYTLMAKIGHGGMAEVFVAVASGLAGFQKLAVVKRIHPQLLEEAEFANMFLDEARLAARLSHPNVVETYDVGEHDGIPFIAMEYMEGDPLDRIARAVQKREGRFPVPLAAAIIGGVLKGLHYAHELQDYSGRPINIVHRDISPSNVFLTYQGAVKMIDFGIAKATTKLAETRTGQIKGKLSYMAPEQARGTGVDRRADVWAVGVMLYELCVGERLFKRDTEIETLQELLVADIDDLLAEGASYVPGPVMEVIRKSLQRAPAERWATAEEMGTALRHALDELGMRPSDIAHFASEALRDRVEAQRNAVADLLSRVEAHTPARSSDERSPAPTAAPAASPAPARDPFPSTEEPRRRRAKSGMIAALLVLAGAIGALAALTTAGDVEQTAPVIPDTAAAPREPAPVVDEPTSTAPSDPGRVEQEPAEQRDAPEQVETAPARQRNDLSAAARRRLQRERRRVRRETEATATTAAEVQRVERPAPEERTGYLTLVTTPWSEVFVGGRSLGTTPVSRVQLPAGTHTLRLRNPEEDLDVRVQITIPAGETVTRRMGLR